MGVAKNRQNPEKIGIAEIEDEEAEDRLIAEIMKIYNGMNWNDKDN